MNGDTAPTPTPDYPEISRGDTGIRVLLTLMFIVVGHVIETILGAIVIFELVYVLISRRTPSRRIRHFANGVIAYFYRIGRYLTYNEATIPFPFSGFPDPLEPIGAPPEEEVAELRDILHADLDEDDEERRG